MELDKKQSTWPKWLSPGNIYTKFAKSLLPYQERQKCLQEWNRTFFKPDFQQRRIFLHSAVQTQPLSEVNRLYRGDLQSLREDGNQNAERIRNLEDDLGRREEILRFLRCIWQALQTPQQVSLEGEIEEFRRREDYLLRQINRMENENRQGQGIQIIYQRQSPLPYSLSR